MGAEASRRPLRGRTIVTTRARRGHLDRRLAVLGADVVHIPLIETAEPDDDGAALTSALDELDRFAWIVVTSANGAERVGSRLAGSGCHLAAVGTWTAKVLTELAGRTVDVVPDRQTALDLAAAMPEPSSGDRLLLAQADRADPAHADAFRSRGFDVTEVVAYRTVFRTPTGRERDAALGADAVAFASGSAAHAWFEAFGGRTPSVVAAIGPSTAAAAADLGIKVSHVAADHSIDGLAEVIVEALAHAL